MSLLDELLSFPQKYKPEYSELESLQKKLKETRNKISTRINDDINVKFREDLKDELKPFKIKKLEASSLKSTETYEFLRKKYIDQKREVNKKTADLNARVAEFKLRYEDHKRYAFQNGYDKNARPYAATELPKTIVAANIGIPFNGENIYSLIEKDSQNLVYPLIIDTKNGGNLLFHLSNKESYSFDQGLEDFLVGTILHYMESFPKGTAKVGVYSPKLTSLPKLSSLCSGLSKNKLSILPEPARTKEQLSMLIDRVSQKAQLINSKLLENNVSSLHELYEKGIDSEQFQILFIHDAIRDMSETNLYALEGLLSTCSNAGVKVIIVDDFDKNHYEYKSEQFVRTATKMLNYCISFQFEYVTYNGKKALLPLYLPYRLGAFPKTTAFMSVQSIYSFVNEYGTSKGAEKKDVLNYEKVGFGNESSDPNNFESISIPCALQDKNIYSIKFSISGNIPTANLVVGIPGTGKSTLIDSLIMNGAMKYSPDELMFELLDFKDGVSSSTYTIPDCAIPHVKVVSQQNKPEEADIILSNIILESERRNKTFGDLAKEHKERVSDIATYNKLVASGKYPSFKKMPRLVIVIDECQCLFEDEKLAAKSETIIRKCRSQGIHLILATQSLSYKMRSTTKFIEGVYVFDVAEEDAEQLLPRKYAQLVKSEVPKGSYMCFAKNGSDEPIKIKIAFDQGETAKYSEQIRNRYSEFKNKTIVIGDKSARVIKEQDFIKKLNESDEFEVPFGENYSDQSTLSLSYNNAQPLVLFGSEERSASKMINLFVSAANERKIKTYIIDASRRQHVLSFAEKRCNKDLFKLGDETNYLSFLNEIYSLYLEREKNRREEHEPIFFIVNTLNLIKDFINNKVLEEKPEIDPDDFDLNDSAALLKGIKKNQNDSVQGLDTLIPLLFNNGANVNIFFILSFSSLNVINDSGESIFTYTYKNALRTAKYKVLYQEVNNGIISVMETSFKNKMLESLNNEMAILSDRDNDYYKVLYYQIED